MSMPNNRMKKKTNERTNSRLTSVGGFMERSHFREVMTSSNVECLDPRSFKMRQFFIGILSLLLFQVPSYGTTYTVTNESQLLSAINSIVDNDIILIQKDNGSPDYFIHDLAIDNLQNIRIYANPADGIVLHGNVLSETPILSIASCTDFVIDYISFTNGHSYDVDIGGALTVVNSSCTISSCDFTQNYGELGPGAIFVQNSIIDIDHCDFFNNHNTTSYGGEDSCIKGGGAICSVLSSINVSYSEFAYNICNTNGGALYIVSSFTDVTHSNFSYNTSLGSGGSICIASESTTCIQQSDATISISNNIFINDRSYFSGGSIYFYEADESSHVTYPYVNMDCLQFYNCVAEYPNEDIGRGGAMAIHTQAAEQDSIYISDVIIKGCSSKSSGGGLAVDSESIRAFSLKKVDVEECQSVLGGGIYCFANEVLMYKCKVANNSAAYGAGIFAHRIGLLMVGGFIDSNEASIYGGGFCAKPLDTPFSPYTMSGWIDMVNTKITNNTIGNQQNPVSDASGAALYLLNSEVELDNCLLANNSIYSTENATTANGAALFFGVDWRTNPTVHLDIINSTISSCTIDGYAENGRTIMLEDNNDITTMSFSLLRSNISGSADNSGATYIHCEGDAPSTSVVDSNIYYNTTIGSDNQTGNWCSIFTPFSPAPSNGNLYADPLLTETCELSSKSPLLDKISVSPLTPPDFDLTNADIGWKEIFVPITLTSEQTDLDRGWYYIPNNTNVTLNYATDVPAGTVIRIHPTASLDLTVSGSGGIAKVGEESSVRTAFCGRVDINEEFASSVSVDANGNTLEFHGTILNGLPDVLTIEDANLTLDGNHCMSELRIIPDPQRVNPQSILEFVDCVGEVRNFDFAFQQNSNNFAIPELSLLRSSMNVINCQFPAVDDQHVNCSMRIDGHAVGYDMTISQCIFEGGSASKPSLVLVDTDPRLEDNQFTDCQTTALNASLSPFTMDHYAENGFHAASGVDLSRLVFLFNAPAYLECGGNSFTYPEFDDDDVFDFIFYKGNRPVPVQGGVDVTDYSRNFWGADCSTSRSAIGNIPSWADPVVQLTSCTVGYLCPNEIEQPFALLSTGLEAESSGNLVAAEETFVALIETFPESREASSAALRLKSMGLDAMSDVTPEELQALAVASGPVNQNLSDYLACASECVRAWQGDRPGAVAALTEFRDQAANEDDAVVAQKSLLEVQTYPAVGGLASLNAGAARRVREARAALRGFNPEAGVVSQESGTDIVEVPHSMQIASVYPNPFNPSTTIRYELGSEMDLSAQVYNLQGQRVETLFEGRQSMGSHSLTWNAEGFASGVYFIHLQSEEIVQVRKVLLAR